MTAQSIAGPAIRVQGLEKSYGKLEVLRGVDFDVARGNIFALLGSNGSGKTTTVRILAVLLKSDAGTASVNGFDVATQPANVRESISLTGQFGRRGGCRRLRRPVRRPAGLNHGRVRTGRRTGGGDPGGAGLEGLDPHRASACPQTQH